MTTRRAGMLVVIAACGAAQRPFAPRAIMWSDPDMVPFAPRPAKYEAPQVWDTIDNTFFAPLVDALAVRQVPDAPNVNALDEVPDSSWFTNRIDTIVRDPRAFARGACTEPPPDPAGPWTVTSGKPDGANPGFFVQHASGQRYVLKPDTDTTLERQSTADVIATRVYHAAGYNTACTEVAFVHASTISIAPTATAEDFVGDKVPFTQAMLDKALERAAIKRPDGRIRVLLSKVIEGKVLGPWKDFGTRDDDPNDVIPHEDRRELRGSYVLGAWLGHYDAREQNSLDTWIDTGDGKGYVKHYQFDFGDCLGSRSSWARVTGRRGHVYEVDWPTALVELLTLGALERPWRAPQKANAEMLGFFTAEVFSPDHYRTAYRYGPYTRVTEADAAWGARILARMSPALIRAVIAEARLEDPAVVAELERILLGRREKLLRRFLGVLSPLARPRIDDQNRLCVTDTRREAGLDAGPTEQCAPVPPGGAYRIVELRSSPGTGPLFVHLYATGGTFQIAGLERR